MSTNFEKYKSDLNALINFGSELEFALQYVANTDPFLEHITKSLKQVNPEKSDDELSVLTFARVKKLPSFQAEYQTWYSECLALIRQIIPDRYDDFIGHYKKPKTNRKDICFENYVIQDALQGLVVTKGYQKEKVVDHSAAIPRFQQQQAILKSANKRFESTLFDIKALMQADILDTEIDSAQELHKHKFYRASGAICGVILEKHLGEVCSQHSIKFRKKNLTIADFNDALKNEGVIDTPKWRNIQYLGDIRNKCDHNKGIDPTKEEVQDLIAGTSKVIKTIF